MIFLHFFVASFGAPISVGSFPESGAVRSLLGSFREIGATTAKQGRHSPAGGSVLLLGSFGEVGARPASGSFRETGVASAGSLLGSFRGTGAAAAEEGTRSLAGGSVLLLGSFGEVDARPASGSFGRIAS